MAPGETKGAGEIHNYFSCCKGKLDDPGCCSRKHLTFGYFNDYILLLINNYI